MKPIDLTGKRFGRLTVVERAENNRHKKPQWRVRCDCGNEKIVLGLSLANGDTQSCGCLNSELSSERNSTHGDSRVGKRTRLYRIWTDMKRRTDYPKNTNYKHYGGRGITVCDEWKKDFAAFRDWAKSHGYDDSLSIDRIDNNGSYEASNCRWVPWKKQCDNKRNTRLLTVGEETMSIVEWCIKTGLSYNLVYNRIRRGLSPARALELKEAA